MDPEKRFEMLTDTRLAVRVKLGEEVIRLVWDVQRPLFRKLRDRYRQQPLEMDSFGDYVELLCRILSHAERCFRADPLIRASGLMECHHFETIVRSMEVQLSADLETLLQTAIPTPQWECARDRFSPHSTIRIRPHSGVAASQPTPERIGSS